MKCFSLYSLGNERNLQRLWIREAIWSKLCFRKMNLGACGEGWGLGDLEGKLARKLLHISKEEIEEAHSWGIEFPMQGRNENAKDSVKVEEIACEHFKLLADPISEASLQTSSAWKKRGKYGLIDISLFYCLVITFKNICFHNVGFFLFC